MMLHMHGCPADATQKNKIIPHEVRNKPWETVAADILTLNNSHIFCIVDHHNQIPIVKRTEGQSAELLIRFCKTVFSEYGLPNKIISESGTDFISDIFKTLCKKLNIEAKVKKNKTFSL